ncbi:hypothetical protein IHC43_002527 [Enterococcus hirae]|nr:hypothetical protein [Enterococcus hirae]
MFLKLNLQELIDTKNLDLFSERHKKDLQVIFDEMEKEELSILPWTIYEISEVKGQRETFVYCLNDYSHNELFIYISNSGKIEPHYFKFIDETNYKSVKAENIQEAIEQNRINWEKYNDFQIQKLVSEAKL